MARDPLAAADSASEAERNARRRAEELAGLQEESGHRQAQAKQLADELTEIDHTLTAIQSREIFKTADDLVQRDKAEAALAAAADQALASADRQRAHHRRAAARRLPQAQQAVLRAEADAEQLRSAADRDAQTAAERAAERDAAAVELAQAWRAWTGDARTSELLGDIEWSAHPVVGSLILDAEALVGHAEGELSGLDHVAAEAARPAPGKIAAEPARPRAAHGASRERRQA